MKHFIRYTFFSVVILCCSSVLAASVPALHFSDITSGPKTGLGDSLGSGAIVTLWGNNLGGIQGTSKVYIGTTGNWHEAAHIYYWENADPANGNSGPADLYTYHKMQEIAFSIPATAPDGPVRIKVTVDGVDSNELDFNVRSGNIYFVKASGSDSADGSWATPWKTLFHAVGKAALNMSPGDIIYAVGTINESSEGDPGWCGMDIGNYGAVSGTAQDPLSVAAYPGASVLVYGTNYGVRNRNNNCSYWNISKITATTGGTGIAPFRGMRMVGNAVTDIVGGCADGVSGALSGGNLGGKIVVDDLKVFGNYVYDFGCEATSKYHHVVYLSNRSGTSVKSCDFGWNYFRDNLAEHCLQLYDEGVCGDFTGTFKVHDNVVLNQRGVAFGLATGGTTPECFTMDTEVYNNLFINVGKGPALSSGSVWTVAVSVSGSNNRSNAKIYNNTIYGYGDDTLEPGERVIDACVYVPDTFGGTWEWVNNIVYDTQNVKFTHSPTKMPSVASNNFWYNGGDAFPSDPPSWDTSPITDDPRFVNPSAGDFSLRSNSPCIGKGTSTVNSIVKEDFRGVSRPQIDTVTGDWGYDIGAFEYIVDPP